jgi:hypothetical protein
MSDLERHLGQRNTERAAHIAWMNARDVAFQRISDERTFDFVGVMRAHAIGTTALFQTAPHNTTIGSWWNSKSVTTLSFEPLGRGWVISEADDGASPPKSWMVLDEQDQDAAPRVLIASRIVTEAPEYAAPPELPYVTLLAGMDVGSSTLPRAFAQDRAYDMLIAATSRLIRGE